MKKKVLTKKRASTNLRRMRYTIRKCAVAEPIERKECDEDTGAIFSFIPVGTREEMIEYGRQTALNSNRLEKELSEKEPAKCGQG